MKCDIVCYFDPVNFEDDQIWFNHILSECDFAPTSLLFTDSLPDQDTISGKDLIFLDFGGIPKGDCYYSMLRTVENLIDYNHDKQFALTMPKWFYQCEEIFKYENVITFDKNDWKNYNNYVFSLYRD